MTEVAEWRSSFPPYTNSVAERGRSLLEDIAILAKTPRPGVAPEAMRQEGKYDVYSAIHGPFRLIYRHPRDAEGIRSVEVHDLRGNPLYCESSASAVIGRSHLNPEDITSIRGQASAVRVHDGS